MERFPNLGLGVHKNERASSFITQQSACQTELKSRLDTRPLILPMQNRIMINKSEYQRDKFSYLSLNY